MFLGQIHRGKSFDILHVCLQQTLMCLDLGFEIEDFDSEQCHWLKALRKRHPAAGLERGEVQDS